MISKSLAAQKTTPREALEAIGIAVQLTELGLTEEEIEAYGENSEIVDVGVSIIDARSAAPYDPIVTAFLDDLRKDHLGRREIEREDFESATGFSDASRRAIERALLQRILYEVAVRNGTALPMTALQVDVR